ncbi:MAG: hypothetical protein ABF293_03765 [Flavobacteriaceae bacterium]
MKSEKKVDIKRRKFLPILGTGLLLPFLPIRIRASEKEAEHEYKTLLKPDGTIVKVKSGGLKNSKVLKKNINNKELLAWLKDPRDS